MSAVITAAGGNLICHLRNYQPCAAAAAVGRSLSRRGRTPPPASLDGRRHACIRRRPLFFPRSSRTGCVVVQAVRPAFFRGDRGVRPKATCVEQPDSNKQGRPGVRTLNPGEEEEQQQKTVL